MASKTSNAVIIERIDGLQTLTNERFDAQKELIHEVMDVVMTHHEDIHGKANDIGLKMRVKRMEDVARVVLSGLGIAITAAIAYLVNSAFLHISIK